MDLTPLATFRGDSPEASSIPSLPSFRRLAVTDPEEDYVHYNAMRVKVDGLLFNPEVEIDYYTALLILFRSGPALPGGLPQVTTFTHYVINECERRGIRANFANVKELLDEWEF